MWHCVCNFAAFTASYYCVFIKIYLSINSHSPGKCIATLSFIFSMSLFEFYVFLCRKFVKNGKQNGNVKTMLARIGTDKMWYKMRKWDISTIFSSSLGINKGREQQHRHQWKRWQMKCWQCGQNKLNAKCAVLRTSERERTKSVSSLFHTCKNATIYLIELFSIWRQKSDEAVYSFES